MKGVRFISTFSRKKIPAVTRVEEWTNALIGVGALIALGSHAINGNTALLVEANKNKNSKGWKKIDNKKNTSPTRIVR